jgi:predicted DNA-binding transcriptional regulator YafY
LTAFDERLRVVIETSARLLALLGVLQRRAGWTGPELATELGVGVRTIRRDITKLRLLGYPIDADPGLAGGYRLGAGAQMPPLLLDDEEAIAVAVGLRTAAGGTVAGIEETSVRALAKLEQVLPPHLRRRVSALINYTVALSGGRPVVDPGLLAALAAACRDRERLRVDYTGSDNVTSRRLVEPHRLSHLGDRWFLVAWDLDRGDWRSFPVDRIETMPATDRRFAPRPAPEGGFEAYVARSASAQRDRHQARVVLHAPMHEMLDRVPPEYGTLEEIDATSCLLRTGHAWLGGIAVYVAYIGVDFTVVDPPELVAELRTLAARFARAGAAG